MDVSSYQLKQYVAEDLNTILGLSPRIDISVDEHTLTQYIGMVGDQGRIYSTDPLNPNTWKYILENKINVVTIPSKKDFLKDSSDSQTLDGPLSEQKSVVNNKILNSNGEVELFGVRPKLFDDPSATVRVVMLLCENFNMTVKDIATTLENEGYNTSESTINMQYNDCRKVLAYLNKIGKLHA